jgi:hypothetical protein
MAVNDITENMWRVNDALRETMRDILNNTEVKNKKAVLEAAIDEYATYMKKRVSTIDDGTVKKSDSDFFGDEPVAKAGRVLSAANLKKLKGAHTALNELLSLVEDEEGDEAVRRDEVEAFVKEALEAALKPITESLSGFEKQNDSGAGEQGVSQSDIAKGDIEDIVKAQLAAALEPITARVSAIEKARGISAQAQEDVAKGSGSESVFTGLDI